ncbi:acetyltransferase [Clostridium sp. JS66]|uniref:acetyltransferase n=1 Tax=Clostridium sp. JS66 TaxID=3064705 RepID=UPI00298DE456|nr:acetyltransferase [Clostridium sp. JS66]WPC41034.1 acetyltransferase [Clostridium sp. JS66]
MKKIVIIGAGGHCKVIIDIIKSTNEYQIFGITDKVNMKSLLDIPIIGDDDILQDIYSNGVEYAFIGLGALENIDIRNFIYTKLKNIGFKLPILIHKNAVVSPYTEIGEGTCVMAGTVINPGTVVGRNCIINTGSVIEHDCNIGYNSHISPNASIAGGVTIGCNTHIGIGSSIIQTKSIGNNVTIGAGTVVIGDIQDNAVAVGIPAKVIRIKE